MSRVSLSLAPRLIERPREIAHPLDAGLHEKVHHLRSDCRDVLDVREHRAQAARDEREIQLTFAHHLERRDRVFRRFDDERDVLLSGLPLEQTGQVVPVGDDVAARDRQRVVPGNELVDRMPGDCEEHGDQQRAEAHADAVIGLQEVEHPAEQ